MSSVLKLAVVTKAYGTLNALDGSLTFLSFTPGVLLAAFLC
ncbi:hypothetical protein ACC733_37890 [Rhizobium johnstonii]